ncbi:acyltransferase, partial [Frankia sp. AgKG'84/4]|uniref:acyltransferase family protein n=1 Tax=Frankia sp. AgKG'84/4 TaxID=573490 RepID=UPI00202A4B2E
MVVVVHSSFPAGITLQSPVGPYFARAEAGVAVFFLISGFLLYRPFVAARLNGTSGAPGAGYLVRRFLRIFPLYWLALAVTLNVVSDDRVGVHGIAGVFQTGLLVQGYHAGWALQGLTQAWTLDIEVAFYLAVPVYAWLMGRRCRSAESQVRVELAALAVTFLASKLVHYLVIPRRSGLLSGWGVWLPVWWDLFAIGMALAVLSARYAQLDRQPRWASLPGSGTACWALAAFFYWVSAKHADLPLSPIFVPNRLQDMNRHLYYGLFALFLLLPAVFGRQDRGIVRPLLACRPMVFLGTISYGIYLWHTTMIDLVLQHSGWTLWKIQYGPFLAIVLGLTIVAATITNRLVERPAIRLSHGWARQLDAWVARRRRGRSEPAAPAAVLSRAGT